MSNDKLRDLTPVDVTYAPGERPTDEKLEGAETQTKEALEYIEATIGDAYGESLQNNLSYISNFTRDIGDRSLLNPILMPDVSINNYIQDLVLGDMEHELDLIPVGMGAAIISSSADSSVVPGQIKTSVALLEVSGDWTILAGKVEGGIQKNSRKLVTHSPSSGGSVTFAEVTSGRGSSYIGARHNTIPSTAQARVAGDFLTVSLSDAINNIYTIQLPVETTIEDSLHNDSSATLSNTKSAIGGGQQMKLPKWLFEASGLDMGTDAAGGGPKVFPANTVRIYDWQEKKIVDGLLEVKASNTAGLREQEIICTFSSDVILDTVAGQYMAITSGTSISELLGALVRDLYFHSHMGDDMIRGLKHSDLFGLRTGDDALDRSKFYGASNIDRNDHPMYLHRDGFTDLDVGGGGNVMRGSVVIGSQTTGNIGEHENYNLSDDSFCLSFGKCFNGGRVYFDKVRDHNIAEGRGNVPQTFSDTAIVIEGALDDGSSSIKTTLVDGNLRVDGDVVLGTDQTHDVIVPGDVYIKNSLIKIPRTTAGLTPEVGMEIYSSVENAPVFWNGSAWVNANSIGYAAVVGNGTTSFGKYNGADAATLQAAITDTVAQGGGKIKILRGSYNYGGTSVNVPSHVGIEGEGPSTDISATGVCFAFNAGTDHSSVTDLLIRNSAKAISVDGDEHHFEAIDIHDSTVGIEVMAAVADVKIGDNIRYTNVSTKIDLDVAETSNKESVTKSMGFSNRLYLIDPTDKENESDKWKRTTGSGTLSYQASSDTMIGYGRFAISGTGAFAFEDLMPVMPQAGIGAYIGMKDTSSSTVYVGIACYNSSKAYLGDKWFLVSTTGLNSSWGYYQNVCVQEGGGATNFLSGTRYIKAKVYVSANGGTVYFDGFNIFPMNFSTITLYS